MARTKQVPTKMPAKLVQPKKTSSSKKKLAEPEAGGVKKVRAARKFKPGTVAMRDIRKAQRHGNRGIPKAVIDSLVREIATNFTEGNKDIRFKKSSLRAIHEAAESFQTDLMRMAGTLSLHAKRKTLDVASMKLASTFMLCPHVFHETGGTAKAMKGCLGNKTKIMWEAPDYPKDEDDDRAVAKASAKDAEAQKKADKKAAKATKAAEAQKKADMAGDDAPSTDNEENNSTQDATQGVSEASKDFKDSKDSQASKAPEAAKTPEPADASMDEDTSDDEP
jgi:histone H3